MIDWPPEDPWRLSRVCYWERACMPHERTLTRKQVDAFVKAAWGHRRRAAPGVLYENPHGRLQGFYAVYDGGSHAVILPKGEDVTLETVLHEVAHARCWDEALCGLQPSSEAPYHTQRWVVVFVELLVRFAGYRARELIQGGLQLRTSRRRSVHFGMRGSSREAS